MNGNLGGNYSEIFFRSPSDVHRVKAFSHIGNPPLKW